jgi:hypothetical protein
MVANEALEAGVSTFTYISAAANFPGIPERYITSKRFHPSQQLSNLQGSRDYHF